MLPNTFIVALRALLRNKLRSVLTGLGIIIGVGAVIAMASIGNGARSQIEARVASLGRDLVVVFPGSFSSAGVRTGWGTSDSLTPEDARAIAREVPGVLGVSPESLTFRQIIANGTNWNTRVLGVSTDYALVRSWPLAAGAMFSAQDDSIRAKFAVLGQTVVEQLGFTGPPLGRVIRINRAPFKVIGVFTRRGFTPEGRDQDDFVVVPHATYLTQVDRGDRLNSILLAARSPGHLATVRQQTDDLLRQRHGIQPDQPPDYVVRTQEEITAAATATTDTMTALLGAIAGVSLAVGGIGIMNIMLVSVTERTREIGIRLAVGAHRRDVMLQFLTEAVMLSVVGGLLGAALGIGSSHAIGGLNGWPVLVSSDTILLAVVFSAGIGVFFGFYPARRAARLDPIEALRHE